MLKESEIQANCVNWFRRTYPSFLIFSVPNESAFRRVSYFSSLGMLNGVSDLIAVMPDTILFIEMKSEGGRLREEQKAFGKKITELGFHYYVCRSLGQFKEIIKTAYSDESH